MSEGRKKNFTPDCGDCFGTGNAHVLKFGARVPDPDGADCSVCNGTGKIDLVAHAKRAIKQARILEYVMLCATLIAGTVLLPFLILPVVWSLQERDILSFVLRFTLSSAIIVLCGLLLASYIKDLWKVVKEAEDLIAEAELAEANDLSEGYFNTKFFDELLDRAHQNQSRS